LAQALVGVAAICPAKGTIFNPSEVMRQGAAANPHPNKIMSDRPITDNHNII
jgi:hypothetical protein